MAARMLGVVLLLAWPLCIYAGRSVMRRSGSITKASVFQWGILPMLTGAGMLASGNLLWLPAAIVAWVLAIPFQAFMLYGLPPVYGAVIGAELGRVLWSTKGVWTLLAGFAGIICMFIICTVVVAVVTKPPMRTGERHRAKPAGRAQHVTAHGDNGQSASEAKSLVKRMVGLNERGLTEDAAHVCDEIVKRYGECTDSSVLLQVGLALFNKGVALGNRERTADAVAAYDDVILRVGGREELELRSLAAHALINKGAMLFVLRRNPEAAAVYHDAAERCAGHLEPVMRKLRSEALQFESTIYVEAGDRDSAFRLLAEAADACPERLSYMLTDADLRPLASDPRWQSLVQRTHSV